MSAQIESKATSKLVSTFIQELLAARSVHLRLFCVGVYIKPTEEQNRKFEERVKWLENVMMPRRELYEAEEKTLRVMLAEEEEEKEKERLENERKKQGKMTSTLCVAK